MVVGHTWCFVGLIKEEEEEEEAPDN